MNSIIMISMCEGKYRSMYKHVREVEINMQLILQDFFIIKVYERLI